MVATGELGVVELLRCPHRGERCRAAAAVLLEEGENGSWIERLVEGDSIAVELAGVIGF